MRRGWLAVVAVLWWAAPAAAQQVFKCTDRHGRVQYTQVKPAAAARSELAMLQQPGRVFYMDDKGERHYQDDAQRQQLLNAAQAGVAQNCE
jgi:hypothetical protein